ncbi:MAG: RHS repeat-associated core domain-containing protein [Paucimonas sp.]|jgi:RHS repeat-associated protein|nr:RHS repeat-associated core domain-containing protein [Paucimonas sp.]
MTRRPSDRPPSVGAVSRRTPSARAGFNGQLREHPQGWYHLGHGRRIYSPQLMRFHCADPLSPFDAGGLNAYAYCQGDPLNFTDPTGRAAEDLYGTSYLVSILTAASSLDSILFGKDKVRGLHAAATGLGIIGAILGMVSTSFSIKDPQSEVVSTLLHVTLGISIGVIAVGSLAKGYPKAPTSPAKRKFARVLHGRQVVRDAINKKSPPLSQKVSRESARDSGWITDPPATGQVSRAPAPGPSDSSFRTRVAQRVTRLRQRIASIRNGDA